MKRVATLGRTERQASVPSAEAAEASTGKEENKAQGNEGTSGHPPSKKLASRKDSAPVKSTSHPKGMEPGLASPVSSHRKEAADARQTTPSHAASLPNPHASPPVLRNMDSKQTTITATEMRASLSANGMVNGSSNHTPHEAYRPATANDGRRQQWQEKEQHSFIFDEITDPVLLTLFEPATLAAPPSAGNAQQSEREQRQRLQPIATAIKKALESVLADVMRKFMGAGKRDGIPKPEVQEAHHVFSEMVQMFNRAKVAAVDGQEARMLEELRGIRPVLEEFLTLRLKNVVQHLSAEKEEMEALKSGLRALLHQCGKWLDADEEETIRPWSPSNAPASPGARQRAVSSPVKPSEPWAQVESNTTDRLSLSLSGHLSPRPSQHRIGPSSQSAGLMSRATSSPLASPLTSPVTSPVTNSKAVTSPKEGSKSLRFSALLASPLSPRSRDGGRKESPVKGPAMPSSLSDSASRSSLSAQHGDTSVPTKPGVSEKTSKPST
jgi:hypothetical protein